MKFGIKKTAIALAMGGLLASGTTLADSTIPDPGLDQGLDWSKDVTIDETISLNNDVDVEIDKDLYGYSGSNIYFWVNQELDRAAVALIDNKQVSFGNETVNATVENTAEIKDSIDDVKGSTQVSVAAGELNQQDNAAAIAVGADHKGKRGRVAMGVMDDCDDDCGGTTEPPKKAGAAASAQAFVFQGGHENEVEYDNVDNIAKLKNSITDSKGNIQVNVAAGTGNQQKNNLAIAVVDDAVMAEAAAFTLQETVDNVNDSYCVTNTATIDNSITGTVGNVQVNMAAGIGNQQSNSLTLALQR